jgi:hypothetical protein
MADEWFYVENGASLGPVSTEELGKRAADAAGAPLLVWAQGMPEWVDARTLPQFAPRAPETRATPNPTPAAARPAGAARPAAAGGPSTATAPAGPSLFARALGKAKALAPRARHEFISYLAVSSYLMVWFLALMFYKATILRSVGIEFTPVGIAVVKALILGKFMLVLEAVKLGERRASANVMIVQIIKKALLFTLALVVMSIIEEVIVGRLHGHDARDVLREMAGGSLPQVLATAILMFLVLLPYMAFRRFALAVGDLPDLLFTKGPEPKAE